MQELGFDTCVDHRAGDFVHQLEAACPAGIDVYFENVGGAVQQAVWPLLNDFARVPVCGLISQYSATTPDARARHVLSVAQAPDTARLQLDGVDYRPLPLGKARNGWRGWSTEGSSASS